MLLHAAERSEASTEQNPLTGHPDFRRDSLNNILALKYFSCPVKTDEKAKKTKSAAKDRHAAEPTKTVKTTKTAKTTKAAKKEQSTRTRRTR